MVRGNCPEFLCRGARRGSGSPTQVRDSTASPAQESVTNINPTADSRSQIHATQGYMNAVRNTFCRQYLERKVLRSFSIVGREILSTVKTTSSCRVLAYSLAKSGILLFAP